MDLYKNKILIKMKITMLNKKIKMKIFIKEYIDNLVKNMQNMVD